MSPEITLITKRGAEPLMSKRIFLDEAGKVRSDGSQCLMVRGHRHAGHGRNSARTCELIMSCGSDQAIALGALKAGLPDPVTITTERKLKENPGAIARSRDFIDYGRDRRPGR